MASFIEFRYLKKKGSMPGPNKIKCQAQTVHDPNQGGIQNLDLAKSGNIVSVHAPEQASWVDGVVLSKGGGTTVWGNCPHWNRLVVRVMNASGQDVKAYVISRDMAHPNAERVSLCIVDGGNYAYTIASTSGQPTQDVREAQVEEGPFQEPPNMQSKFIQKE